MRKIFDSCRVILADEIIENGYLVVEDGIIKRYGQHEEIQREQIQADEWIDGQNFYLAPGFIDVHSHGGGGGSFMEPDYDQYRAGLKAHRDHGTTTILPTVLARSVQEVSALPEIYERLKEEKNLPYVPGFFFEGPYISQDKNALGAAGGLKKNGIKIQKKAYEALYKAAGGSVKRWMIAPELEGAMEFGRFLKSRGVIVCMGHSLATYEQAMEARRNGFSCVIHLYTTMSTVTRKSGFREGGLLEAALLNDELDCEIICDGCHLPPELIRLAVKCKGYDKLLAVSDSGPFAGTDFVGEQEMLGMKVLIEDGVVKMADRSCFAGSIACGDTLVRTCYKKAGLPLWAAVRMATKTPARHLGIQGKKGEIVAGADADLVLFDDQIQIQHVYLKGNCVV